MLEEFISKLKEQAENSSHIESVLIVGSYARGTNKENSDIDIIIISSNKSEMVTDQLFTQAFGEVHKQQTEYYGACTSIRVWYGDGKEVEFGIVEPSWISIPLDSGTFKVLTDGYKLIVDKRNYFENIEIELMTQLDL